MFKAYKKKLKYIFHQHLDLQNKHMLMDCPEHLYHPDHPIHPIHPEHFINSDPDPDPDQNIEHKTLPKMKTTNKIMTKNNVQNCDFREV